MNYFLFSKKVTKKVDEVDAFWVCQLPCRVSSKLNLTVFLNLDFSPRLGTFQNASTWSTLFQTFLDDEKNVTIACGDKLNHLPLFSQLVNFENASTSSTFFQTFFPDEKNLQTFLETGNQTSLPLKLQNVKNVWCYREK